MAFCVGTDFLWPGPLRWQNLPPRFALRIQGFQGCTSKRFPQHGPHIMSICDHVDTLGLNSLKDVTIGLHADPRSASGAWRGQVRAWEAFAEAQAHGFLLDKESYFSGSVFARYADLYWASSTHADDGFWLNYGYLCPQDPRKLLPSHSFAFASLDEVRAAQNGDVFQGNFQIYVGFLEGSWGVLAHDSRVL